MREVYEEPQTVVPTIAARQLVLCLDGTNNNLSGGFEDTNVVRICEVLLANGAEQLLYYGPGVGNPGSIPGVTWDDKVRGRIRRLWGLALGKGVYENIADAYIFLMRNWREGDQVFIFGFSRGAFSARSTAGMVDRFGILPASMESFVPTLLHFYFADPQKDSKKYQTLREQILQCFCDGARKDAWVHFVGVWDTVESVGSPFSRTRIRATASILGKRFRHVRHALALDEHRRSFTPRLYEIDALTDYAGKSQTMDQRWFSGAHGDVGGGYSPDQATLSVHTFIWMLGEAVMKGLRVKPSCIINGELNTLEVKALIDRRIGPIGATKPIVHAQTFETAWWAFSGLAVRNCGGLIKAGSKGPPDEDQSVAQNALEFPTNTVWEDVRGWRLLVAMCILVSILFFAHGAVLLCEELTMQLSWGAVWASLKDMASANKQLAAWQLWGWTQAFDVRLVKHWILMCLADGALMFGYGYVLARGVTAGFAALAGLRRTESKMPRVLNWIGMALPVTLCSDVLEDLLTLSTQFFSWLELPLLPYISAIAMSFASTAKWAGFTASIGLCLVGFISRLIRK